MKQIILLIALLASVCCSAQTEVFPPSSSLPQFPGFCSFNQYINEHLRYPCTAESNNMQGEVIVSFTVTKKGTIENIKIVRSPYEILSNEVIRILKESPRWIPGKEDGIAVDVNYTSKITFRLS